MDKVLKATIQEFALQIFREYMFNITVNKIHNKSIKKDIKV
jgi:hypothetical protein